MHGSMEGQLGRRTWRVSRSFMQAHMGASKVGDDVKNMVCMV